MFSLILAIIFNNNPLTARDTVSQNKESKMKAFNTLSLEEARVIIGKGTERPFSGKYDQAFEKGIYTCKQCDAPLYESESKFDGHCGWPSFDDEIDGAVKKERDTDGRRTEILCANCNGHLGHVFLGEGFTEKNTRHCVNSVSMNFIPNAKIETAIFASGCFWGTEYHMQKVEGVISTTVGYTGGHVESPSYKQVCTGATGHAESVEVKFDSTKVSYETLAKLFFETHDPTQEDGQGPDIGEQYRSGIFYTNDAQKLVADSLIQILEKKGYDVVTEVTSFSKFYVAENYHQDYYDNKGTKPYCHIYRKKF
jgi:peptide methionine sulfoxide reductase msrA/msrB